MAALIFSGARKVEAQQKVGAAAALNAPVHYGAWRSCKIGGSGYIQNIVTTRDPKVLYRYVDVGGIYRSGDGGRRWRMLHGHLPAGEGIYETRGLSVDARDENRILAAIGSQWVERQGVFESRDGGRKWKKVLSARFMGNGDERWTGFLLTRNPRNPDAVVVASESDGVFRSNDSNSLSIERLGRNRRRN